MFFLTIHVDDLEDHQMTTTAARYINGITMDAGVGNGAFISEDDDMGPMGSRSYMSMMTDDHSAHSYGGHPTTSASMDVIASGGMSSPIDALPFLHLEPPLSEEDYNFALEESEGITELFTDVDLQLQTGLPI